MDSLYGQYSASSADSTAVASSSPDATHVIDKPDSILDNLLDCAVAVTDAQCAVVVEKVEAQLRAFEEHLALYQEDAARAYDELAQEHAESCAALRASEREAFVRLRSTVDAAVSTTDLAIAKVDASTSTSDLHAGATQSSALDACSTADLPRSSDLVPQTPLHTTPPADDIPFLQFPSRSPSHTPSDFAAQLKDKDDQIRILQTMVNDAVVNNVNMHPYAAFPGFHDPGPSELRTVDPAFLAAPDEHEIAVLQAALRAKEEALNTSAADVESLRRALGEKDQEIDTLEKRCRRYQSKFVKTRKEFSSAAAAVGATEQPQPGPQMAEASAGVPSGRDVVQERDSGYGASSEGQTASRSPSQHTNELVTRSGRVRKASEKARQAAPASSSAQCSTPAGSSAAAAPAETHSAPSSTARPRPRPVSKPTPAQPPASSSQLPTPISPTTTLSSADLSRAPTSALLRRVPPPPQVIRLRKREEIRRNGAKKPRYNFGPSASTSASAPTASASAPAPASSSSISVSTPANVPASAPAPAPVHASTSAPVPVSNGKGKAPATGARAKKPRRGAAAPVVSPDSTPAPALPDNGGENRAQQACGGGGKTWARDVIVISSDSEDETRVIVDGLGKGTGRVSRPRRPPTTDEDKGDEITDTISVVDSDDLPLREFEGAPKKLKRRRAATTTTTTSAPVARARTPGPAVPPQKRVRLMTSTGGAKKRKGPGRK